MPVCPECGHDFDWSEAQSEENAFRSDPDDDQTGLDEVEGVSDAEGSGGFGVEIDEDALVDDLLDRRENGPPDVGEPITRDGHTDATEW